MKTSNVRTIEVKKENPAFEPGTSAYWNRHAKQREAKGEIGQWFNARRMAEKALAGEQLKSIGWGDLAGAEQAQMLVEALRLLRPHQRGALRKKLKEMRSVVITDGWRLPRLVFAESAPAAGGGQWAIRKEAQS
jgi:hypothetical protein